MNTVTLPGGMMRDGRLVRAAVFRELTGRLEQRLAAPAGRPAALRISEVLAAALASLGGEPVTRALVDALSVSDRQFLMLALALQLDAGRQWRQLHCSHCGSLSDIGLELSELPVSSAGTGYPFTDVSTGGRCLRLRVPTGEDEMAIAGLQPLQARALLARRCWRGAAWWRSMPSRTPALSIRR